MFITSQFPTLNFSKFWISPPEYFDFKEHTRAFSHVAAYTTGAMNLSEGDRPERVNTAFVTASMFDVLGVRPQRGSVFTPEQDRPGADPVVVLSHEIWQRAFGADPADRRQGRHDPGTRSAPCWASCRRASTCMTRSRSCGCPSGSTRNNRQNRGSHFLYVVGRLAPGVTAAQANAELQGMLQAVGRVGRPDPRT